MKRYLLLPVPLMLLCLHATPSTLAQSRFPSPSQIQRIRRQFPRPDTEIEESKIKQHPDFSIPKIEWKEDTEGLEALAMQDFNSGNYEKAAVRFAQLTWIAPKVTKYHAMRGKAHSREANHLGATLAFSNAIELEPDNADLYTHRGVSYKKLKMGGAALQDFNQAIALDPNHLYAYIHRGALYRLAGEYENAIADFSKAIELKPELAHSYYYRGTVFAWMKQRDKAIQDISQAATLLEHQNQKEDYQFVVEVLKKLKSDTSASP